MKILYYFLNLDTMMFQWQHHHIVDELKRNGHEIVIISPYDYKSMEEANEAVVRVCKATHFELFMTSLNEKYLFPNTIKAVQKLGTLTLLFTPDNLMAPFNHQKIGALYDLVWLTARETQYMFKKWGCKTIVLPYAANPHFLKPNFSQEEQLRVGFIGNPHGSRIDRINALLGANIPVTIHCRLQENSGPRLQATMKDYFHAYWNYAKYPIGRKLAYAAIVDKMVHRKLKDPFSCLKLESPVPWDSYAEMNSVYALVLSTSDANSTGVLKEPVPIVNLRHFEVPMSGGLQFTTYTDEIAEYFEDGKEIVLCKTKEEYIDKAKFYLRENNDQERYRMKLAARKRAEAEHTWIHRFNRIFDELGLT